MTAREAVEWTMRRYPKLMARLREIELAEAPCDSRRMAETGTGSGRSPTSAVAEGEAPNG